MLKKRILTALVALPFLIAFLYFVPKNLIFIFFLILAMGSSYETSNILLPALRAKLGNPLGEDTRFWCVLSSLSAGAIYFALAFMDHGPGIGVAVFSVMVLLLLAKFLSKSIDDAMANMLGMLFSVIYGCLPWVSLLDLYVLGDHSRYVFLLLGIVMTNDTGAYFVGRYFGKNSLAPLSSPKKTWEGALGGVFSGVIGAWVINVFFLRELGSWSFLAFVAVIAGSAGILGDLMESTLKRFGGVKDSGALFPGHGGLLDRTDSVVFAAPVLWFLLYIMKSIQGI